MLTVEDLLSFQPLSETRISPDGARVAYVVGAALAGPHAQPEGSRIWLVEVADGASRPPHRQLTRGPHRDSAPAWSPDGRTLAFLSDRAERGVSRLYLLALDGGEAQPVTTPSGNVKQFAWSPDGAHIAFVHTDSPDDAAFLARAGGDQPPEDRGSASHHDERNAPVAVEEEPRYDRVWTVEVASGAARRVGDAPAHVWELAWFPDGTALAVVVADEPTAAAWYSCRLARLALDSGALTTLHAPPPGRQVTRPAPSPDGQSVAFVACAWSDPGLSGGDLWLTPASGAAGATAARNLTPGVPFSVNHATWQPDGSALLYDAFDANASGVGLVRLAPDATSTEPGWQWLWRGPYSLGRGGLSVAANGLTFAAPRTDPRSPGDVWLGRVAGDTVAWQQLTDLHGERAAVLTSAYEDVWWTAPDGLKIGGLLMRPAGASGPAPLVVVVHGGPTAMMAHSFQNRSLFALAPLLAARGVAILLPNYRGSNGRGVAFAEANRGDLGGTDYADIVAGIDHLIAAGIVDPQRLGIAGWSYGGFMTMWAVTQTDRFKAAVAGAGLANWLSFHGASSLHTWDRIFFAADPYDPGGPYATRSPVRYGANVTTPVLLLHGDADRDVPPDQSREFFRALKDHGRETQLVLYPGAGHGPTDPRHVRDVIERSLAWFTDRL